MNKIKLLRCIYFGSPNLLHNMVYDIEEFKMLNTPEEQKLINGIVCQKYNLYATRRFMPNIYNLNERLFNMVIRKVK